jgi:hypothetical protein
MITRINTLKSWKAAKISWTKSEASLQKEVHDRKIYQSKLIKPVSIKNEFSILPGNGNELLPKLQQPLVKKEDAIQDYLSKNPSLSIKVLDKRLDAVFDFDTRIFTTFAQFFASICNAELSAKNYSIFSDYQLNLDSFSDSETAEIYDMPTFEGSKGSVIEYNFINFIKSSEGFICESMRKPVVYFGIFNFEQKKQLYINLINKQYNIQYYITVSRLLFKDSLCLVFYTKLHYYFNKKYIKFYLLLNKIDYASLQLFENNIYIIKKHRSVKIKYCFKFNLSICYKTYFFFYKCYLYNLYLSRHNISNVFDLFDATRYIGDITDIWWWRDWIFKNGMFANFLEKMRLKVYNEILYIGSPSIKYYGIFTVWDIFGIEQYKLLTNRLIYFNYVESRNVENLLSLSDNHSAVERGLVLQQKTGELVSYVNLENTLDTCLERDENSFITNSIGMIKSHDHIIELISYRDAVHLFTKYRLQYANICFQLLLKLIQY